MDASISAQILAMNSNYGKFKRDMVFRYYYGFSIHCCVSYRLEGWDNQSFWNMIADIFTYPDAYSQKCDVSLNQWCNGVNKKTVQLRSQTAGGHGTNKFEGAIVVMCEECRKANNGGFKIL